MNRREYISMFGGVTLLAGCVGNSNDENAGRSGDKSDTMTQNEQINVAVTDLKLEAGEAGTLTVTASQVNQLRFDQLPEVAKGNERQLEIKLNGRHLNPGPTIEWTVSPPTWQWDSVVTVEGSLPVRTEEDIPSGEYEFQVKAANDEVETTEEGKIRVV